MGSVQGVRQLGPSEVFASAPGGCDSNCKSAEFDTGLKKSTSEKDVHAASISAAATNAALRPMSLYRTVPSPSRIFRRGPLSTYMRRFLGNHTSGAGSPATGDSAAPPEV